MDTVILTIQAIATIAIVATLVVYWRQLIAMQKQLAAMQHSSRSQSLLTLIDYLQRPRKNGVRSCVLHGYVSASN